MFIASSLNRSNAFKSSGTLTKVAFISGIYLIDSFRMFAVDISKYYLDVCKLLTKRQSLLLKLNL